MKRILRTALVLLLCLTLYLCLVPAAHAEEVASGEWGSLHWTLDDDGLLTISGEGEMGTLYNSTNEWRRYQDQILEVVIMPGVTSIGDFAFCECRRLTSVTIPDSVTSIGYLAFFGCRRLVSVNIPRGVSSIDISAFNGCNNLNSIWVSESNTTYSSDVYGVLFDKTKSKLIKAPYMLSEEYIIPSSAKSIDSYAFSDCKHLLSVTIPESVTSIGPFAFRDCDGLASITIPESVTTIGDNAFHDCDSLTNITIPESVTRIGGYAYYDCDSLTSVTIPGHVTSMGDDTFYSCKNLVNVTVSEGATNLGNYAFIYCYKLTTVTIPESIKYIDLGAFRYCNNLKDIYYAGTKAQWEAIDIDDYNDPLLNATIHYEYQPTPDFILPASLTTIEAEAFAGGAFTYVHLPEGATVIRSRAFADCPNLAYIYIPEDTAVIAKDAFSGADGLTILGRSDSYAEFYAQRNDYTFVAVE